MRDLLLAVIALGLLPGRFLRPSDARCNCAAGELEREWIGNYVSAIRIYLMRHLAGGTF
jgi:hypothetical protein